MAKVRQPVVSGRSGWRLLDTGGESLDINGERVCNRWKIQIPTFPTVADAVMSSAAGQSTHQQVPRPPPCCQQTTRDRIPWKFLTAHHHRACRAMHAITVMSSARAALDVATRACGRVLGHCRLVSAMRPRAIQSPAICIPAKPIIGLSGPDRPCSHRSHRLLHPSSGPLCALCIHRWAQPMPPAILVRELCAGHGHHTRRAPAHASPVRAYPPAREALLLSRPSGMHNDSRTPLSLSRYYAAGAGPRQRQPAWRLTHTRTSANLSGTT